MAKKEVSITEYLDTINHPLKGLVLVIIKQLMDNCADIEVVVKWNSPCFVFTGQMKPFNPKEYKRDILVLNLHKKDYVLLVFPTGAIIQDTLWFLEGNYPDGRKTAKLVSIDDFHLKADKLINIIKEWISKVD